jgi:hypothetical protein
MPVREAHQLARFACSARARSTCGPLESMCGMRGARQMSRAAGSQTQTTATNSLGLRAQRWLVACAWRAGMLAPGLPRRLWALCVAAGPPEAKRRYQLVLAFRGVAGGARRTSTLEPMHVCAGGAGGGPCTMWLICATKAPTWFTKSSKPSGGGAVAPGARGSLQGPRSPSGLQASKAPGFEGLLGHMAQVVNLGGGSGWLFGLQAPRPLGPLDLVYTALSRQWHSRHLCHQGEERSAHCHPTAWDSIALAAAD